MKKTFTGLMVICLALFPSCKKKPYGGSWTFKGKTYNAEFCQKSFAPNQWVWPLIADTYTPSDNVLTVTFLTHWPPVSNTFAVADSPTIYQPVQIGLTLGIPLDSTYGGTNYYATSGNGTNQTIYVQVSSAPNYNETITGSGIMMRNANAPFDSALLSFDIVETD